ncbi:MAG: dockerin type I repeat-containing protein [Ruminococcus sp.]|nr:dockerin type I repeat-containing protein [Ruminococcus sp.]
MNKFKKITSAVVSALTVFPLAVPVISTAETADIGLPYEVFEKSVMFFTDDTGSDNVDFIISGSPNFKTQRPDGNLLFQPIASGTYKISRTWLKEEIIQLGNTDGHVHYFYPCIENYEVNYSTRNTTVEFLGARDYRNESTVKKYSEITDINDSFCLDVTERNCDDILKNPTYYAFITDGSYYNHDFVYYDYGYNSVKDKSLFCLRNGYNLSEEKVVDLSGNIAVKDIIWGCGSTSNDLTEITCDEVPYMIIEPTAESGMGEIFYERDMDESMQLVDFMMTIENGIFVNSWTMGCVLGDYGDLDMDDRLTVADIVTMNKYILGMTKLTNTQKSLADMNWDGVIDSFDLVMLKQEYFGDEAVHLVPLKNS